MKKFTLGFAIALTLSCLLVGCGSQGPDPQNEKQQLERAKQNDEKSR